MGETSVQMRYPIPPVFVNWLYASRLLRSFGMSKTAQGGPLPELGAVYANSQVLGHGAATSARLVSPRSPSWEPPLYTKPVKLRT